MASNESKLLTVINETGVHARPASMIFQIAKKYKSDITLKTETKEASAKSVISILGLGLKFNSTVKVVAVGEDSVQAVNEIVAAIESGLGEKDVKQVSPQQQQKKNEDVKSELTKNNYDFSKQVELSGVIASPGLVIGKSLLFLHDEIVFEENASDSTNEFKKVNKALQKLKDQIKKDIDTAKSQNHTVKLQVFDAHLSLLEDDNIFKEIKNTIDQGKSSAYAVNFSIDKSIEILKNTQDQLLIERVDDLTDLKRRLLKIILDIPDNEASFEENSIIVAEDLVPSDVTNLNENVIGVILAKGSATTHVSLILRNMGIPCLVNMGHDILEISNYINLILNANDNCLIINPTNDILENTIRQQKKLEKIRQENVKNAKKPAITKDSVEITVKGNVSNAEEASKAFDLGAYGIGLLRSEFLFFNSQSAPSQQTQTELYQKVLDVMEGNPITLRTLDVGGDKPLPYVKIAPEENPILGMRGIRTYSDNMDVFITQLKAIFSLKPLVLVKIMLPMVADVEGFLEIKEIITKHLKEENITDKVDIGTMIEIPSAALTAKHLAKYADFLSIGTNDLAQYTMAMDRGNPALSKKLSNLAPSLLKLIHFTVQGAKIHNKPVAVCGAMASEIKAIPILIGLGIKELSTSMRSIPNVKALIRELDYKKCKKIAEQAMELDTIQQVSDLIKTEFNL